jgi:serine/threonine protein kinase
MEGSRISHYRILRRLGSGGMGEVYSAEDERLRRNVAIKFISVGKAADENARRRFEREAQAASALNHPNICTVLRLPNTAFVFTHRWIEIRCSTKSETRPSSKR